MPVYIVYFKVKTHGQVAVEAPNARQATEHVDNMDEQELREEHAREGEWRIGDIWAEEAEEGTEIERSTMEDDDVE